MPITINYDKLPSHMVNAVRDYIERGRLSDDFLRAMVRDSFKGVMWHADSTNARMLQEWAEFMYNEAPAECWGSDEKVEAWRARGGLLGKDQGQD